MTSICNIWLTLTCGSLVTGPPRCPWLWFVIWGWIGSFIGISVLALLAQVSYELTNPNTPTDNTPIDILMSTFTHTKYAFDAESFPFLVGSYGASAALVYGAPESPLCKLVNESLPQLTNSCS